MGYRIPVHIAFILHLPVGANNLSQQFVGAPCPIHITANADATQQLRRVGGVNRIRN